MLKTTLPYILLAGAFWPSIRWYAGRLNNITEAAPALLALLAAIVLCLTLPSVLRHDLSGLGHNRSGWGHDLNSSKNNSGSCPRNDYRAPTPSISLAVPTLLVLIYAATFLFVPGIVSAFIAFTAICSVFSLQRFGRVMDLRLWGLFTLALPVIPSLQFYLGYPYRASVAAITSPLINFAGYSVAREGTCLSMGGDMVCVDAPCSGVNMLWAGLFLTFTLACVFNLNTRKTVLSAAAAMFFVYAGNVLRSLGLFFFESGIFIAPPWMHQYIGIVSFIFVAVLVFLTDRRLKGDALCECEV